MSTDEAASLALAKERVIKARRMVDRRSVQIAHSEALGRSSIEQRGLLRLLTASLAAFEDHVVLLEAPRITPLPFRL